MLTPAMVHQGTGQQVLSARAQVLNHVYQAHPQHFVNHKPVPEVLPQEVWFNPPLPPVESSRDASGDPNAPIA
jgi:hypothetical protein